MFALAHLDVPAVAVLPEILKYVMVGALQIKHDAVFQLRPANRGRGEQTEGRLP